MKVYLSMSSKDLDAAKTVMDQIREAGFEIAHDWTASFDPEVGKDQWPRLSQEDVDMVAEADVMVLCGEPTSGCYVELGAALLEEMPVFWVVDSKAMLSKGHFFLYNHSVVVSSRRNLVNALLFLERAIVRSRVWRVSRAE